MLEQTRVVVRGCVGGTLQKWEHRVGVRLIGVERGFDRLRRLREPRELTTHQRARCQKLGFLAADEDVKKQGLQRTAARRHARVPVVPHRGERPSRWRLQPFFIGPTVEKRSRTRISNHALCVPSAEIRGKGNAMKMLSFSSKISR